MEELQLNRHVGARVGAVLKEKWTLERVLGIGGMAAVYAARHRNGKRVAIKILHPHVAINSDARTRFAREGYAANTIGHAGVVLVDDDDVTPDGAPFLVMEQLEGETLDARAERLGGVLPVGELLAFADQLLDVLAAAHDKGVIHRDLKPENLFLTTTGALKVLDFGIARVREVQGSTTATRTGATMGTPAFMAPEQARGRWELVDARTDLWAVGATMFSLLTGHLVHEAGTVNEVLGMAMMIPARPIATLAPALPSAVAAIVDRALALEPAQRWDSARAMQSAVRAALASAGAPGVALGVAAPVSHAASAATVPDPSSLPANPSLTTGAGVAAARSAPHGPSRALWIAGFAGGVVVAAAVLGLAIWRTSGGGTQSDPRSDERARSDAPAAAASSAARPIVEAVGAPSAAVDSAPASAPSADASAAAASASSTASARAPSTPATLRPPPRGAVRAPPPGATSNPFAKRH